MRFIMIEQHKGIFLGMLGAIPLFSNVLELPIVKAISTETEAEALNMLKFIKGDNESYKIALIDTELKYIPIDILIKAGHSNYVSKMFEYLPAYVETIQ